MPSPYEAYSNTNIKDGWNFPPGSQGIDLWSCVFVFFFQNWAIEKRLDYQNVDVFFQMLLLMHKSKSF